MTVADTAAVIMMRSDVEWKEDVGYDVGPLSLAVAPFSIMCA